MTQGRKAKTINIKFDRVEVGNMWTAYFQNFQTLLESSEKIVDNDPFKDFQFFKVKLMLRAMSIECLLKTLLTKRGFKLINADGRLNNDLNINYHNLNALNQKLDIIVSEDEIKMLNILSDSIEIGRYPVLANDRKFNVFWVSPLYEKLFYSYIDKTIKFINIETANA